MVGKELVHNGRRAFVVAYAPPTEDEPMALWKIHFMDGDSYPPFCGDDGDGFT